MPPLQKTASGPVPMPSVSSYDFSDLRVLVVDDNVHMCRLVRTMLNAFGIRSVIDASDGAEALERLEQSQVDLLVIDWEMPVLDGADLVRLIRKPDHPHCYIPIIMITGHSTYRRTQEALALGINDVLSKPFSPRALFDRIAGNVLYPRPFIRTADYFGPKPRIDPSQSDPLGTNDAQQAGALAEDVAVNVDPVKTL